MITIDRECCYKWSTFLGAFLLNFPFGLSFFWGNFYVYVSSYILHVLQTESGFQAPWILALKIVCVSVTGISSSYFSKLVGRKFVLFAGVVLTCLAYGLSYVTIQNSNILFIIFFGAPYGLGCGLDIIVSMEYVLEWAGERPGLFISVCRSGTLLGAVLTNQFLSHYINPSNQKPDHQIGPATYFSQKDILNRVPYVFLFIGGGFLVFQTLGLLLMRSKNDLRPKDTDENATYGSFEKEDASGVNNNQEANGSQLTHVTKVTLQETSMTAKEMMKTSNFYTLYFTFLLSNISLLVVDNYYKSFGQLWIHDDRFLSNVGTLIPVASAVIKITWGLLMDKYGVKFGLVLFTGSVGILSSFYYITPIVNAWLFGIVTLLLAGIVSAQFAIFNIATVKVFGRKHQSFNFGIMMSASVGAVTTPPLIEAVLFHFGWLYIFYMVTGVSLISVILVVVMLKL